MQRGEKVHRRPLRVAVVRQGRPGALRTARDLPPKAVKAEGVCGPAKMSNSRVKNPVCNQPRTLDPILMDKGVLKVPTTTDTEACSPTPLCTLL